MRHFHQKIGQRCIYRWQRCCNIVPFVTDERELTFHSSIHRPVIGRYHSFFEQRMMSPWPPLKECRRPWWLHESINGSIHGIVHWKNDAERLANSRQRIVGQASSWFIDYNKIDESFISCQMKWTHRPIEGRWQRPVGWALSLLFFQGALIIFRPLTSSSPTSAIILWLERKKADVVRKELV